MAEAKAKRDLCRRYCAAFRRELSPVPRLRRRAVRDMRASLEDYLDCTPDAAWSDLERDFGRPRQAAENILNNLDATQLRLEARHLRWRRVFLLAVLGAALAYVLLGCGRLIISRVMQPGYVVIGPAVVDEDPMPTNTPIEPRSFV